MTNRHTKTEVENRQRSVENTALPKTNKDLEEQTNYIKKTDTSMQRGIRKKEEKEEKGRERKKEGSEKEKGESKERYRGRTETQGQIDKERLDKVEHIIEEVADWKEQGQQSVSPSSSPD